MNENKYLCRNSLNKLALINKIIIYLWLNFSTDIKGNPDL